MSLFLLIYTSPRAASGTSVSLRHEVHEGHEEKRKWKLELGDFAEVGCFRMRKSAVGIKSIKRRSLLSILPFFVTFVSFVSFVPSW
jgi:hypothetical protein